LISNLEKIDSETNKSPVVYVIKLVNADPAVFVKDYRKFHKKFKGDSKKMVPPVNEDNEPSKILYVGKSEGGSRSRLIAHLEKDEPTSTGSLCLGGLECDIEWEVELYVFPKNAKLLLGALEKEIAKQLKPSLGLHK